ncbi:MAG: hypothetical protein WC775_02890 [Patescibacteria group bacterium]
MIALPFFHKKTEVSAGYVFLLFLAGEKIYGIAFNKNNPQVKSSLYVEHADPFLKDAAIKLDKILANCERDLGKNIFLKETVLFVNSLYVTESGTIREDFLKSIKKLLHDMELANDGYVNFYEALAHEYGKHHQHYYLFEESMYDYVIYELSGTKLVKTVKVAKTQNEKTDITQLLELCPPEAHVFAFYSHKMKGPLFAHEKVIEDKDLGDLFMHLYLQSDSKTTAEQIGEVPTVVSESEKKQTKLHTAPGFVVEELGTVKQVTHQTVLDERALVPEETEEALFEDVPEAVAENKTKFSFDKMKYLLPKFQRRYLLALLPVLVILMIGIYVLKIHGATVYVTTEKENFSTQTSFVVGKAASLGKSYTAHFSETASMATTGQKSIGSVSKGEVTIYSGLFQTKTLPAGTQMKTSSGVSFTLAKDTTVPGATTSGTLDTGGIVTKPGKITLTVSSSQIGPEGNINQNTKMFVNQISETDMYGVANQDFTGGYRRKVRVFSEADAAALEKKVLAQATQSIQKKLSADNSVDTIVFNETVAVDSGDKQFSEKVNTETDDATLTYSGDASILYAPKDELIRKVQQEKLKNKEFVAGTFTLSKLKLSDTDKTGYTYSAQVNGKVQRFVDKKTLAQEASGKTTSAAIKALLSQHNITNARIATKPIPIPFIPWDASRISIQFEN